MRKQILWVVIGLVVAGLAPTVAVAGNGFGSCVAVLAEGKPDTAPEGFGEVAYLCADSFGEEDCDFFCGEESFTEGDTGLFLVDCIWESNSTCDDMKVSWDGSCQFGDQLPPPLGGLCVLISENLPNWTSEEICEFGKIDGTWDQGGTCGAPVPTLPKVGQAALMIVLMFGALVILNISGIIRSA